MRIETRRLLLVWLVMAALTVMAIPIGHATDPRPLGAGLILALLAAALVKSALLLHHYLGLGAAPGWNRGLRAGIAALLLLLGALSIIAG